MAQHTKRMVFQRFGRSHHLRIQSAEDLALALSLDETHWVATSAPIETMNCDRTFLELVEGDHNGRITCTDVKSAIRWLLDVLADTSGITAQSDTLLLDSINDECDEGKGLLDAASKILQRTSASDTKQIPLEEVRAIKARVESTPVSEAGVVLPEATDQPDIKGFLTDIVNTLGGTPHPSGNLGVNQAKLNEFLSACRDWLAWEDKGKIPPDQDVTDILPFGADTDAIYKAYNRIRGKIDQYFAQCQALALDERFVQRMGWTDTELADLDFDDPTVIEDVLQKAPLARARKEGQLVFADPVNPYYVDMLGAFRHNVVGRIIPQACEIMSGEHWKQIKTTLSAYQAWVESKPDARVAALGCEKLQTYLQEEYAAQTEELIALSKETAFNMNNIRLVEKALLYQSRMLDLANNFISFPHLYSADRHALFENGTLVMDGRKFTLAVLAANRSQHSRLAQTSNMFVMYVKVGGLQGRPDKELAIPVTSGGKGNICVGKRGVFYDIDGDEHDAEVVAIIENPISLREALVSPFQRLGKLLSGKIESLTTSAEKKLDTTATTAMTQVTAQPSTSDKTTNSTGSLLVGGGVAIAALGSAWAFITKTLAETELLYIFMGVLIAVLVVLIPTSIIGILKLRKRDLSAILEGSEWAVNARMRLTRKQGKFFTHRPGYAKGSRGVSRVGWKGWLLIAVLAIVSASVGTYLWQLWKTSQESNETRAASVQKDKASHQDAKPSENSPEKAQSQPNPGK